MHIGYVNVAIRIGMHDTQVLLSAGENMEESEMDLIEMALRERDYTEYSRIKNNISFRFKYTSESIVFLERLSRMAYDISENAIYHFILLS